MESYLGAKPAVISKPIRWHNIDNVPLYTEPWW